MEELTELEVPLPNNRIWQLVNCRDKCNVFIQYIFRDSNMFEPDNYQR